MKFNLYYFLKYAKWDAGFGKWKGKPKLAVGLTYYDGWIFYFHLFQFYLEAM